MTLMLARYATGCPGVSWHFKLSSGIVARGWFKALVSLSQAGGQLIAWFAMNRLLWQRHLDFHPQSYGWWGILGAGVGLRLHCLARPLVCGPGAHVSYPGGNALN